MARKHGVDATHDPASRVQSTRLVQNKAMNSADFKTNTFRGKAIKLIAVSVVLVLSLLKYDLSFARLIRISHASRSLTVLPAFVAVEEGFFRKEGLEVELIQMRSNIGTIALMNDEVAYTLSYAGTLEPALMGLPIQILMVLSDSPHYLVAGKEYSRIHDLKGKVFGVSRLGGSLEYATGRIVEHYGIKREEIKIISVGDEPVRRIALERGLIAATLLSPPGPVLARRKGFNVLLWVGDIVFSPQSLLATQKQRLEKKKDEVKAVVRAMVRATEFIRRSENQSRVAAVISRYFAVKPEDAAECLQLILPALVKNGILEEKKVKASIEETAKRSYIQNPSKAEQIFDFSLAREVLSQ